MRTEPTEFRLQRDLTPFLARELLPDFIEGRLDRDRREAMQRFLDSDTSLQEERRRLEKASAYLQLMQGIETDEPWQRQVRQADSWLARLQLYRHVQNWPDSIKWILSGVAVSVFCVVVLSRVPWHRIKYFQKKPVTQVVLADLPKPDLSLEQKELSEQEIAAAEDESETEGEVEESVANESLAKNFVLPPQANEKSKLAHDADNDEVVEHLDYKPNADAKTAAQLQPRPTANLFVGPPTPPKSALAPPTPTPAKVAVAAPSAAAGQADPSKEVAAATGKKAARTQGFVYRAFMNLDKVDTVSLEIAQLIRDLGGEKAGEVPLGWHKGTGSYFHFTLPESNNEQLMQKLRAYGPVRISKDPHPRVMPEGQIRFILWVDALKAQN